MHDNVETCVHEIINKGATSIKVIMASNAWVADLNFGAIACLLGLASYHIFIKSCSYTSLAKNHLSIFLLSVLNCSYS